MESLKFHLFETFNNKEIEYLFWNQISKISNHKFVIRIDSFSQLENKRIFNFATLNFLFLFLSQSKISLQVSDIISIQVTDLSI